MWTVGLKTGCRIRKDSAVINLKFVMRAGGARSGSGKVSTSFRGEGISFVVRHHRKLFHLWRPNAKMRFVCVNDLRSYRITPLHSDVFSSGLCAMVVRDLASPPRVVRSILV